MAENLENQNGTNTETTVETNTTTQNTQTTETTDNSELFDKLDAILEKRIDGLTKSILKDNGTNDDDIKEIISQYKAQKAVKTQQASDELKQLKKENALLKSTILDGKLSASAVKVAKKLDIDDKYIPQVMKLADLSKVTIDGEVNEEALNQAMAKVIEECDVFKKANTGEKKGFKNIGATYSDTANEDGLDKIRAIMGLNNKK